MPFFQQQQGQKFFETPSQPNNALLQIGDKTFEVDDKYGIRPYGDKPTAEHQLLAQQMQFLGPLIKNHESKYGRQASTGDMFSYSPVSGSKIHHGVYHLDPQKWYQALSNDLQLPFTPTEVQPNPGPRGG